MPAAVTGSANLDDSHSLAYNSGMRLESFATTRYQLEVAEDYESFDSQRQSERDRHGEQRRALDKAAHDPASW